MNIKQTHIAAPEKRPVFSLRHLSVQLGLVVIGLSTIVLFFFGGYQVFSQTVSLEEKLELFLKNEAVQLSASLSTALFNFDDETLKGICNAALQKPEIIKVTLWDIDLKYLTVEDEVQAARFADFGQKKIEYPISFGKENLGKLEIVVTMAFLEEKIQTIKQNIFYQVVILDAILGLCLVLVLNLKFIKPLQELNKSSEKIAAGDLDYPIDTQRKDELGTLASNLVTMRDSVKEKVLSLHAEVDQHHKTSLALEKSESFLRLIIDIIPHMIFVKDQNGRFLVANQAVADQMETTVEEIVGRRHQTMKKNSVAVAQMLADDQRAMLSGQTLNLITESHEISPNRSKWYSTKKVPFTSPDGDNGVVGITIDVSELKQAEEQLKATNNFIDSIINSMPSALFSLDREFKVTKWNHKAEKYYGVDAGEAISKPLVEILPQMEPFMSRIRENIQTQTPYFFPKQATSTPMGTVYEEITVYPLIGNNIEGVVIRVDDVTDHVRMEEMVVQSEKMLSVGGLAAGMAHEINNPLAGMMQNAQVVLNRIHGDIPASVKMAEQIGVTMDQLRQFMDKRGITRQLESIHDAGVRASVIVQNMLSFSRKDLPGKVMQNIPELLDQTIEVANSDYNLKKQYDFKKIKIQKEYQADLPEVLCEVSKIQQVFFNIFKNSAEAMHDSNSKREPVFCLRAKMQGGYVCVEIGDNGPGMDEETRKRIFEPFFTTKAVGKGTGLGLSVSYFIITENHNGEMRVISEPDKGTTFSIKLPVS